MPDLSQFPITQRWPAQDPNVIQLYSFPTPNGVKVSIALEEMGDPNGPNGPVPLFESGAILIYLAEKSGKFIGTNAAEKATIIQWLMFQMGGVGPMFGQMGYFVKFAGSEIEDPRPRQRYIDEAKRLLNVLNTELADKDWIAGSYSIADMAIAPWLIALDFYGAKELVGYDDFTNVAAYVDRFLARPAVQNGRVTPARP